MTMGINSNYEAFVNWADTRSANTIASASRADGQMVVSNKVGDGIGFLAWRRRDADQVSANNATRELFFAAVRDMFGGEAFIPQSVKDAMHFDTFKAWRTTWSCASSAARSPPPFLQKRITS